MIFGSNNIGSSGNFDLKKLNGTNGFVIQGTNEDDLLGKSISSAGDINNDGFDDIIITSPYFDTSKSKHRKKAYVIFGGSIVGSSGKLKVSSLNGSNGFAIRDRKGSRNAGLSVSNAGDVNNDGIDDIVVGTLFSNSNKTVKDCVIYGASQIGADGVFELSSIDGSNGFTIAGEGDDAAVRFVSSAGDVNDDGIDDLIFGAPHAGESDAEYRIDSVISGDPPAGRAYVVFGSQKKRCRREPSALQSPSETMALSCRVLGVSPQSRRLRSSSSTTRTLCVRSDTASEGCKVSSRDAGASAPFKKQSQIKLSDLDGSNGFLVEIDFPRGHLGRSVSGVGDLNADAIDDIIVGSSFAGSYVIFGDRNIGSEGTINVLSLDGSKGFALSPDNSSSFLGHSVSSAGDFNADSIADLAIVAAEPETRFGTNSKSSSDNDSRRVVVVEGGIAYVIYGSADLEHLHKLDLYQMNSQQGLVLQNYGSHLYFTKSTLGNYDSTTNKSISNLGDVNGDGIDDLIVGIPGASDRADSYVIFGSQQSGTNANEQTE